MKSVAGRARLIWGASGGELAFCAILAGIAITICCAGIPAIADKFRETEMLSLAARNRIYWAELWATEGRRESAPGPDASSSDNGRYTIALRVKNGDGSRDFRFKPELERLRNGVVTIRPSISATGSGALVWLCGRKPAPRGFMALGRDRTDVADEKLVFACRSHP